MIATTPTDPTALRRTEARILTACALPLGAVVWGLATWVLHAIDRAERDAFPVPGHVVAARVITLPCRGTKCSPARSLPAITTVYRLHGQLDTTYRATARNATGVPEWAAAVVAEHPVGRAVTVWVPRDRQTADGRPAGRNAFLVPEPRGSLLWMQYGAPVVTVLLLLVAWGRAAWASATRDLPPTAALAPGQPYFGSGYRMRPRDHDHPPAP